MMSGFEDGQQHQEPQQQHAPQPLTPLRLTNEAANNSNNSSTSSCKNSNNSSSSSNNCSTTSDKKSNRKSIMSKVKFRVSSIISDSVCKWFSPATSASVDVEHTTLPSTSPSSSLQHNGSTVLLQDKEKHGSRRIQLEADDAADLAVDDGTDAQDLNDEEVQLADNIAEHDLAGEDEQTRRSEYNVSLLRKRQLAVRDDDDDDDEEDDDEPEQRTQQQQQQQLNYHSQLPTCSVNFRSSTSLPIPKRKRLEPTESPFSPQLSAQRRRPQLHASTPAASDGLRNHAPPNRFSAHLRLNRNQAQREPAYNFMSAVAGSMGGSSSDADVATSGDLPMSSRRSLNIAPMTERRDMALPSYKRKSLPYFRRLVPNRRSYQTINEVPNEEQQQQTTTGVTSIIRQETNNNNNNTSIPTKRSATDSHSECESNESHAAAGGYGVGQLNNNNNIIGDSNSLFYGNLQSRKSVFSATMPHHNSTLSLNSLNQHRRFNASIYGSTSALSDSRLLSSSVSSALSGSSPFYHGPTAFGGSSANNRYFSQDNLAVNSRGSSPVRSHSDTQCNNIYGIRPVDMRPRVNVSGSNADAGVSNTPGLSLTAQRILNLLEHHSTPLMDAKKMGSTLREHQQQRSSRHAAKPYSYSTNSYGHNNNNKHINTSDRKSSAVATESDNHANLLVPTMLQLLDNRRLHRVAPSTRALFNTKQREDQNKLQQHQQPASTAATASFTLKLSTADAAITSVSSIRNSYSATNATNSATAVASGTALGSQSHSNKMRSRLSHHHPRKDTRAQVENELAPAPLDLPNIRFPDMASEPKFDLIIAPLKATATEPTTTTFATATSPITTPAPSSLKKSRCYKFATPLPINCASAAGEATCLKQKRVEHNFTFSPPRQLDELPQHFPNSTQFNGSNLKMTPTVPERKSPIANNAVLPLAGGFGDQFKKSCGEWECEACMVRNKTELSKCMACETPKPKAKGTTTSAAAISTPTSLPFNYPTGGGFGDRFKQPTNSWECDACLLSNKSEHSKCVACETPRKQTASSHGTQVSMPISGGGSSSSSFGGSSNSNSFPSGFGDAFKPNPNTWECGSCMLFNQASCNECIACQAPNPKGTTSKNNNNSSSSSSSNNFKFGFAAAAEIEKPKPDAGFQQLIAAQKSSSWNCEACMAQNDINRNKCICCDQLKPGATPDAVSTSAMLKFMFGFTGNAATTAAGATTTNAEPIKFTAPVATAFAGPAKQFQIGFTPAAAAPPAASQDAADGKRPLISQGLPNFGKLGKKAEEAALVKPAEKAINFNFGNSATQQPKLSLKPSKAETDLIAAAGTRAPETSSSGLGLFTPAPATTTTTLTSPTSSPKTTFEPAATFTFGKTAAPAAPAESKLFKFGSLAPNTAVSSSTSSNSGSSNSGSSSSCTTTTTTSIANNFMSPSTNIFKFGGSSNSNVSSTTSSSTLAATGTATTSLIFGQTTPIVTAATVAPIASLGAAAAAATTKAAASGISFTPPSLSFAQSPTFAPAATAAVTASTFVFGNQPNVSAVAAPAAIVKPAADPAPVVSSSSKNFFFVASTASSKAAGAAGAAAASTSNASGNTNIFGSITTAKSDSQNRSFSMPPASNNKAPFAFGSTSSAGINSSFGSPALSFGAKPVGTPAVGELAAGSSSGNAAGNSGSSSTTNIMGGNKIALSGFGWPAAAATPAAASPFAAAAAATPTTAAIAGASPFASNPAVTGTSLPVFGSGALFGGNTTAAGSTKTNAMQSQSSPFGAAATAAAEPRLAGSGAGNKALSNVFGNISNPFSANSAPSSPANIFSAPATATVAATATKPAFNFVGGSATPTPAAASGFNFCASPANAAPVGVVPKPAFNFTAAPAPQAAAFNFSANSGNAGSTDSTPNAAPFQFNAGAPAAPANIFAFNPPQSAGNAMQNPRRKIRAPMRRLPPR